MINRLVLIVLVAVFYASFVVCDEAAAPKASEFILPKIDKSKVIFADTFQEDPKTTGWVESKDEKYSGQEWKWDEAPGTVKGFDGDKGLIVGKEAKHYGIAHPVKIDTKDKDFVFQYEVKYEKSMQCGGSYVKLLQDTPELKLDSFTDRSPYIIMFGPDFCGSATDKVHFIFRHYNPVSKQWEEKHMKGAPLIKNDQFSHVYTLVVRKDNTFEVLIDNESVKKGSLLEDFDPAVIPPKEIDDPTDSKPSDWVDDEYMDDPEAKKPEDWNEDEPLEIVDPEDKKPDTWLDNEPARIPDPEAKKPADWDDEEDGKWEAPLVENPKCKEFGCGEWKPRMIRNPAYKGKWKAPKIKNPAYKGQWKPKQIPNPNYFEDKQPSNFPAIGAVAIEIWTMQNNILFDNFYVSYDPEAAKQFAEQTWRPKFNKQKEQAPKSEQVADAANPLDTIKEFVTQYPIPIIGTILAILLSIPLFCCRGGDISSKDDSPAENVKLVKSEEAGEEKVEEKSEQKTETITEESTKTPDSPSTTTKRKNKNKTKKDE